MVQFYRKTEIVNDTGLFEVYPDLFVGKDSTMEVKGGTASRRAVMEFLIADAPTFGDSKLSAVRPNFYINSVDLNDTTELPRYKGYVFNKHLSEVSNPQGGLSISDESMVIINTTMSNDGAWIEEKFDGAPRQIGGDVPELEVQNGTVIRTIDRAISVDNLIAWLRDPDITGGDGNGSGGIGGWISGVLDEAEYSDDFDEYLEKSDRALKNWLATNYGLKTDNMQGTATKETGWWAQSLGGLGQSTIEGAGKGWKAGWEGTGGPGLAEQDPNAAVGSATIGIIGSVAGAAGGSVNHNPDAYHKNDGTFNDSTENYVIPIKHEKRRGRKDYYRPKKDNKGPSWWIHSKDIDRSGYLIKDLKVEREVESAIDVKSMIHPGNSIFDTVRRQKSYWIADPEDYNNEIEAAYTRSFFTSAGGLDGQAAQLETHWRHIDSAEVSDRAIMVPMAENPVIDNRQELLMQYGHIPRPNEREVYHAGAFDVWPEGMSAQTGTNGAHASWDACGGASRNTLVYERLLDSKVATKVSWTVNFKDLEFAWVEPILSGANSVAPVDSTDGIITSRRGLFCTMSRNPVKNAKAGQKAHTFADYLQDNMTEITDYNTNMDNRPGTFVLGFLNFPSDHTIAGTAGNGTGYIHDERQNKISVVWSDYWGANYASDTNTKSIGWKIDEKANLTYQGHLGADSAGDFDVRWMGLTNGPEDQDVNDMVLLDGDTWYTIDMYMHPKVPCIRVHITDAGTGKRVDGNNILIFCGPNAVRTTEGIRATDGYDNKSMLGDESRWPSYFSLWLNNTHWKTTLDEAQAEAGYDIVTPSGDPDKVNQVDIFTGGAAIDGINASSTVLVDNFQIFNANTTKSFNTISNNTPSNALGRIPTSSYSEVEGLYKPAHYYLDNQNLGADDSEAGDTANLYYDDGSSFAYVMDVDTEAGELTADGLSDIIVTRGGSGYDTDGTGFAATGVEVIIAGGGEGASADVVITGGKVTDFANIVAGTGYAVRPTVSLYGGSPTKQGTFYAVIGTTAPTKEIVRKIPAPRYTSIGFDSIPTDMYTIYGNVLAANTTTTKIFGAVDWSSGDSMMAYNAGTQTVNLTKVHKGGLQSRTNDNAVSVTNPQTAVFSSITDNELIGGKLKIHYSDDRVGDAGCQSAVRDIVAASNTAKSGSDPTAYVEVWPPLPLQPDASDDWEIQSRAHILFNDLVTRNQNDTTQMLGVPYGYARPGFDLDEAATSRTSKGVFNLGWNATLSDCAVTTSYDSQSRAINGTGDSPAGTVIGGWNLNTTGSVERLTIKKLAVGEAPNGSTNALVCFRDMDSNVGGGDNSVSGPVGFRRSFTNPVDLTNCDIMVIVKIPSAAEDVSAAQYTEETYGGTVEHGQALYIGGPNVLRLNRGPQFGAFLRLGYKPHDWADEDDYLKMPNNYGAWTLHKNLFMEADEEAIYARATNQVRNKHVPSTGRWLKLVFSCADFNAMETSDGNGVSSFQTPHQYPSGQHQWRQHMQSVSYVEFGMPFEKQDLSGSQTGGVIYVAGVYAVPRNVGDVMAGFSHSRNNVGEISKETFMPVRHSLPSTLLDGVKSSTSGLHSDSTISTSVTGMGLTVGGREKINTGYHTQAALTASATSIAITEMTGAEHALHVDDRIMLAGSKEIIRISAITDGGSGSNDTLTIERGVDGTTAESVVDDSMIYVTTPSDAELIIRNYDYDVEGFTQKGFATFGFGENSGNRFNEGITWEKRENPLAATRVIEIVGRSEQSIQVRIDQPEIFQCENDTNTQWVVYSESGRGVVSGGNNTGNRQIFYFDKKQLSGDILSLPKKHFFSSLPDDTSAFAPKQNIFISPYKYWIWLRYQPRVKGNSGYNVSDYTKGDAPDPLSFSKRSYKSIVKTTNRYKGVSSTLNIGATTGVHHSLSPKETGPTWRESTFNDGKYLNAWDMNYSAIRPVYEQGKDYGFGTASTEEPEKGQCFEDNAKVGWAEEILPNVVSNNNLTSGSKVSFMIAPQDTTQRYSFSINTKENTSNSPYLITTYFDGLPVATAFSMTPNEENPMFPDFRWSISGGDLWYGFIKTGTDIIQDQYHNKELHIPMNEETTSTLTVNNSTSNVTTNNITMTREGLAGYAVDFSARLTAAVATTTSTGNWSAGGETLDVTSSTGFSAGDIVKVGNEIMVLDSNGVSGNNLKVVPADGGVRGAGDTTATGHSTGVTVTSYGQPSYLRYGTGSADPTPNCTTYMSVVAHVVPDSGNSDDRYILSQEGTDAEKFYIKLNQTNQVEARVWYSDDGYIDLTSASIIPADGYTPSVVILTVDTTSREGNVKLYVNGKLDDQTGVANATGTTDNWKLDTTLNSGNGYLVIGNKEDKGAPFDGRLEEFVIYKDLIYPVDIKSGIYTLTKPLKEVNSKGKRLSHSCVLFAKDYHNIRGVKPDDVCRTPAITFSKSTPAVTGA